MLLTFVSDFCKFSFAYIYIILFHANTLSFTLSLRAGKWHLLFIILYVAGQNHGPQRPGWQTLELSPILSHPFKTGSAT